MTDERNSTDLPMLVALGAELRRVAPTEQPRRLNLRRRPYGGRPRRLRSWMVVLAVAFGATGAATAAGVPAPWQPVFGSPQFAEPQPRLSSTEPPSDQLASLAVLRREQTQTDRGAASAALQYFGVSTEGVRTAFIRAVDAGPAGPAILVPAGSWHAKSPTQDEVTKQDVVCLFVPAANGDGGAKGCYTTKEILGGDARLSLGHTLYMLVPDVVGRVVASFGHGRVGEASVSANLAAVTAPEGAVPWPLTFTWLSDAGSVVKRSVLRTIPLVPPRSAG